MFLSAIILGYKQFELTTQVCIRSLLPYLDRPDLKLMVLDNGSPDESASQQEKFLENYPQIQSMRCVENLGYAGGMNFAAKEIHSDWLLLIGSDTVFAPGSLDCFMEKLSNLDSNIGIVGPVTNEAGTAQKLQFKSQDKTTIFEEFHQRPLFTLGLITPIYRADFFCVAIRYTLWAKLGGLSLDYGLGYYEDFDFCLRAHQLGYKSVMLEDVLVYHAGSVSFKSDPEQSRLIKKNKKIFIKKFPKAELRHRRLDQFKIIEYYLTLSKEQLSQKAFQDRIRWRLQMIEKDLPRSFWKKWRWLKSVKRLEQQLNQFNGLAADNTTQI